MHLPPSSALIQATSALHGRPLQGVRGTGTQAGTQTTRGDARGAAPTAKATAKANTIAPETREAALQTALRAIAELKKPALNANAPAPAEEARILPRGSVLNIQV
jgi:hypothetical protein